ncbi:MAG TPA: N-acetyltransferase [Phaeodactylibacter sp.]|nr:N-acetyltransferase [Phaeodactylibacter sp.]
MVKKYIFQTNRLGIRNWQKSDFSTFIKMGQDQRVMEYFPWLLSESQSIDFIKRMQVHFEKKGYAYLPIILLENQEFMGMVGLLDQNYDNHLGMFTDIGWRLKPSAWGKGYATEAAKAWLKYGFEKLKLKEIYSVVPVINTKSQNVMHKIGLKKIEKFGHPKIDKNHPTRMCYLFSKNNL